MRIGLLTEGGYPYVSGEARLWCDRLVRGLEQHEFDLYALATSQEQEDAGWLELPPQVMRVRTAPMWAAGAGSESGARDGVFGRRARRRFAALYRELVEAVVSADATSADATSDDMGSDGMGSSEADRFANALYGLAELARDEGGLGVSLRSEAAVRILERACRAPGALRAVRAARVPDLLSFAAHVERELRPLSLDWYEDGSGFDASGHSAGSASVMASGSTADETSGASASPSGATSGSSSGSSSGFPSGLSGGGGLASVDLCHAASGGAAALPGLIAKHFYGVPLLVTEYGVQLRARYIAAGDAELSAPVRALLAAFHGRLAAEVYRQAAVITPGNAHARRWQERCGADRAKLRTIHPGMEAGHFAEVGEREGPGDPDTLVWVGRIDPSKDLISLLHAFSEIRKEEPKARLRIVGVPEAGSVPGAAAGAAAGAGAVDGSGWPADGFVPGRAPGGHGGGGHGGGGADASDLAADREAALYLGHCKALAAQLFPDEAEGIHAVGENPVSFEELGAPEAPDLADVYGSCGVVVLSSVVEGFPISLVEAMFCGRATVSTDAGAVVEVIGGTGLVVPPRNPRALAEACVALLRDPARRERLGAAARARALELFTAEQNITAFHSIYLEIVSRCPVRREVVDDAGDPLPFAYPPEAHVPGRWTTQSTGDRGGAWLAGRAGGAAGTSWGAGGDAREQLAGMTQGSGEADG
ncbi:DUF3492 domain-containing protein [Streptomyces endophyticus]|uniref:D-inositol 3-phosphate glycosyltransferase n=1 Tax=Streptomyces endophyticus TaxID=714166 RepID=A0ABU6EX73_9ACTN|nr:DUF3492 domain-containing protein [Streptomyces endophyticus]MEB8336356.1 DUF3492 domain-containing protein [Streptomyces endophyticus]